MDDVDAAEEGILARGDVVLIGTDVLGELVGGAAHAHDLHVEAREVRQRGNAVTLQPVGTDYADKCGVGLDHVHHGEVGATL